MFHVLLAAGALGLMLLVPLASYVLYAIAYFFLFPKLGEPRQMAFVPVYNTFLHSRRVGAAPFFWVWLLLHAAFVLLLVTSEVLSALQQDSQQLVGALATIDGICSGVYGVVVQLMLPFETVFRAALAYTTGARFGRSLPFILGLFAFQPIFLIILARDPQATYLPADR